MQGFDGVWQFECPCGERISLKIKRAKLGCIDQIRICNEEWL